MIQIFGAHKAVCDCIQIGHELDDIEELGEIAIYLGTLIWAPKSWDHTFSPQHWRGEVALFLCNTKIVAASHYIKRSRKDWQPDHVWHSTRTCF